jgi:hypothetical protein
MIVFVLLLFTPQTPVQAPKPVQGSTVTVVAKPVPAAERKVCTREVPIGSMFAKKVCRSIVDTETTRRDAEVALERVRASNAVCAGINPC